MRVKLRDRYAASIRRKSGMGESVQLIGIYEAWCVRDGKEIWRDQIKNVVTDVGANLVLNGLMTTAVTVNGPYLGLISAQGYTAAPAAGNTMASHSGWYECDATHGPQWQISTASDCNRIDCTADFTTAASRSIALSAAKVFTFDGVENGATVKGAFLVLGSGAVVTNGNTSGTLFSAGLFTGGDKGPFSVSDELNVAYSLTFGP